MPERKSASPDGRARTVRLAVDGYYGDRAYGFGRYVRELTTALDRWSHELEIFIIVPEGHTDWTEKLARCRVIVQPSCTFPLWEQVVIPLVARRHHCDVIHFPYQSSSLLWPKERSIVTIHDLMFLTAPVAGSGAREMLFRLFHMYRRVAFGLHGRDVRALVAVSHATQLQLSSYRATAMVVPNVCESFVAAHGEVAPATDLGRFFLHRGHPGPHKNTRRIVEAFGRVRRLVGDVSLVIYGRDVDDGALAGLPTAGVIMAGAVSDERLAAMYRAAVAVVVASLEEGFALSIIEGFGFETAVVTSRVPPMSDIAGNAALLVDPYDVGAIAEAMQRLLLEPELKGRLLQEGKSRYLSFSSRAVARQLAAIYRSAASSCRQGRYRNAAWKSAV